MVAFQLGATHLVRGHNPINFCNGLLFGNTFSLVILLVSLFESLLPLFGGIVALGLLGEAFSTNLPISSLVTAIGIVCVELG